MPSAAQHFRNALPMQSMLQEYRIEQVLGAGGFGITYRARDTNLDKDVALKEYLPGELAMRAPDGNVVAQATQHEAGYKWGLDRFLLEARTAGAVVDRRVIDGVVKCASAVLRDTAFLRDTLDGTRGDRTARLQDWLGNRLIADLTWPARPRLIVEVIQPILGKAVSPLADCVLNRPDALRDRPTTKQSRLAAPGLPHGRCQQRGRPHHLRARARRPDHHADQPDHGRSR